MAATTCAGEAAPFAGQPAELRIEALGEDDFAPIAALARQIWLIAYRDIVTPAQIDYMLEQRYSASRLRADLADPACCWRQAWLDGQRVGFFSCLHHAAEGEVKLDKLYVHPDWQRRGIGSAMLDAALAIAATLGAQHLVLAVNKQNAPALAAYAKYGFRQRAAVKVDIGGGFVMDDFIMARAVLPPGAGAA